MIAVCVVAAEAGAYSESMRKDLLKRTLRMLDLPEDLDPRVPRITVLGRDRMLVENVSGVRRCAGREVLLLTGCGALLVEGQGLLVKELGESRALLTGRLERWSYGE